MILRHHLISDVQRTVIPLMLKYREDGPVQDLCVIRDDWVMGVRGVELRVIYARSRITGGPTIFQ